MSMLTRDKIRRALENPGLAFSAVLSRIRGQYYRLKFKLLRRRVIIGRGFKVEGPLVIRGPGTVIFGDDCAVIGSRLRPVTPFTHAPDAVIHIGNRVVMTGTRLGCQKRIEVHDDVGLSEARIMDTDFHAVELQDSHRANTGGVPKPIVIGEHAWIGAGAWVLKGVRIGQNSVVGAAAVVAHNVPANVVVFGNPARIIWRIRRRPEPVESHLVTTTTS